MYGFAVDVTAIARHALNTPFVYLTDAEAATLADRWVSSGDRETGTNVALAALADGEPFDRAAVLAELDAITDTTFSASTYRALREWAALDPDVVAAVVYTYSLNGYNLDNGSGPESDADSCAVFYEDGTRHVDVVRAARGGWRLASSPGDYVQWPVSVHERARFATVDDAVAAACTRGGMMVRRVSGWMSQ